MDGCVFVVMLTNTAAVDHFGSKYEDEDTKAVDTKAVEVMLADPELGSWENQVSTKQELREEIWKDSFLSNIW